MPQNTQVPVSDTLVAYILLVNGLGTNGSEIPFTT